MVKHIKVNSISTAWEVAASIFPTDYKKTRKAAKEQVIRFTQQPHRTRVFPDSTFQTSTLD